MIGIIGAMKEEVDALLQYMENVETTEKLGYLFYRGTLSSKQTVLMQSGIGKVNDTLSTILLMESYPDIDQVINIGSAGGLMKEEQVGDVVIGSGVVHHDVDLVGFQYPLGQLPDLPLIFEADGTLLEKVKTIFQQQCQRVHVGIIASGDQFVCRQDQVDRIQAHFPMAICAEMEAACIAQVCYIYQKRFITIRSLSDVFGQGNSAVQFDQYLQKASQASALMCVELLKSI